MLLFRHQKFFAIKFIAIAISGTFTVAVPSGAKQKLFLQDGLKNLEAGKYDDALVSLTNAIQQSSDKDFNNFNKTAELTSKVKSLDEFLEIGAHSMYIVNSRIARGVLHSKMKHEKEAFADFNAALVAFPFSAKALCNRGRLYLQLNKPNEALKDLNESVRLAPRLPEAFANRAIAYRLLHDTTKEKKDLQAVVELKKDEGHIYSEQPFHRRKLAESAYQINPKNVIMLTDMGYTCAKNNEVLKAIPYFKKAIAVKRDFIEAYGGLIDCYLDQENYEAALSTAKTAERINPNDRTILIRLTMIYKNTERMKEAAPYIERILKMPAKSGEDYRFRALCYMATDRPREALQNTEKSLTLNPRNFRNWDDKALSLTDLKRYSEALKAENQAIDIKPNFTTGYIHRAQIHSKLHNLEAADADLEKALRLDPSDKEIYRIKGAVEAMKGNFELSMADGQTGSSPFKRSVKAVSPDALKKEIASYSKVIATIPSQAAPYYDRALLFIASDDLKAGITDLKTFLKLSKWNGHASAYAASLLILVLRENGEPDNANQTLKLAAEHFPPNKTVPILDLLCGRINAQTLLKKTAGTNAETREHLLLGIHLWQTKQLAPAQQQFDWVLQKGDQNIDEYVLVSNYLRKLVLTPRKELHQFDSQ